MKKREKILLATSIPIFLLSWGLLTTFVDMAKSMGEAKEGIVPARTAFYISVVIIIFYTLFYYLLNAFIQSLRKKT